MSMCAFCRKMADGMYGLQWRECSISATEQLQRKTHKFLISIACFVRNSIFRTNRCPEVRYDLTETHTHRRRRCAYALRVNFRMYMYVPEIVTQLIKRYSSGRWPANRHIVHSSKWWLACVLEVDKENAEGSCYCTLWTMSLIQVSI